MWRGNLGSGAARRVTIVLLTCGPVILAGCAKNPGSFDQTEPLSNRLSSLVSFNKLVGDSTPEKPVEHLPCPPIDVLDGTDVHRVYNGAESSDTLRYQYSIGDVARECIRQGDQIAMKVGVGGQVLLGPAGSATGAFSVPIRIAVVHVNEDKPVVSKLYAATVTMPAGQTEGTFTVITEPLLAPFIKNDTADDYTIKVGIDASAKATTSSGPAKRKTH